MNESYTEQEIARARAILEMEHAKELARVQAEAKKFVGRYFKEQNSYSGGVGSWPLYMAPKTVSEWGLLYGIQFEHKVDSEGDHGVEIDPNALMTPHRLYSSTEITEITQEEFEAARDRVLDAAKACINGGAA